MAEDIGGSAGRDGRLCGTTLCETDIIPKLRSVPNPTDKVYSEEIMNGEFIVKSERPQENFYSNFMSRILNAYHKLVC